MNTDDALDIAPLASLKPADVSSSTTVTVPATPVREISAPASSATLAATTPDSTSASAAGSATQGGAEASVGYSRRSGSEALASGMKQPRSRKFTKQEREGESSGKMQNFENAFTVNGGGEVPVRWQPLGTL